MPFTIDGEWVPSKKQNPLNSKVKVMTQTKKGRVLTLVLNVNSAQLNQIMQTLKKQCHCGGAVQNGTIELQGQHLSKVQKILKQENIL